MERIHTVYHCVENCDILLLVFRIVVSLGYPGTMELVAIDTGKFFFHAIAIGNGSVNQSNVYRNTAFGLCCI